MTFKIHFLRRYRPDVVQMLRTTSAECSFSDGFNRKSLWRKRRWGGKESGFIYLECPRWGWRSRCLLLQTDGTVRVGSKVTEVKSKFHNKNTICSSFWKTQSGSKFSLEKKLQQYLILPGMYLVHTFYYLVLTWKVEPKICLVFGMYLILSCTFTW